MVGGHEELDSLEESECIQLLHKTALIREVASDTQEYAYAVSLVKHLGHHTLAVLHAGSYIATAHCSIAEYLELLQKHRRQLLDRSGGQGQSRYDTVYATFEASIEFLKQPETGASEETRKDSLQILNVLSTFHYTTVPLQFLLDVGEGVKKALTVPEEMEMYCTRLTAWHVAQLPDLVRNERDEVKFRITEAVSRLESLALVRTEQSGRAWKSVSMHPLVHGWAGDRQSQQEIKAVLRMTECIVALSYWALGDWRPYYIQLMPHLKQLVASDVDLVDDAAQSRCVLQVCVQIAWIYHWMDFDRDMYEFTSRIFHRQGLHDQEPTVDLRELYHVFAVAIDVHGSYPAQAIRVREAIERLDQKTLDENDSDRLKNLRNLGEAYQKDGQANKAVALLEKVVKAEEELGEEHDDLLRAQNGLASSMCDGGQIKEGIALLEKVVKIRQRLDPEDNPDRLASQHELAVAYLQDGQIAEATLRLEEVARIEAQTLGEEHPSTAMTQNWLGDAYEQAGRLTDAIEVYERAVNVQALALAEEHPELRNSRHNLAIVYLNTGRIQEAINTLERVVNIENSTLDDTDQEKLSSQHQLGRAYLYDGRVSGAIEIFERVVAIKESTLEEKDSSLLASQHWLGQAYLDDGRVSEAIEILEHVVEVESFLYEQGHPERVISQDLLEKAHVTRDSSLLISATLSVRVCAQPGPFLHSVEELALANADDRVSEEAERQGTESIRDSLEGISSKRLV